ncbi:hypothetical protein AAAU98_20915 [Enterocloster citroniae]
MDVNDWLQTFAEASNYPESVIREFSSQVPQQDSIYFDVNGPTMSPGIITRDYIFFEGGQFCVIKRSDIIGAYFINLIDIFNTKNRTGYCLHVAIFSNHNTCIVTRASQKRGKHLIEMLTEKHPEIDTAGGRILSGTLEEVQSVFENSFPPSALRNPPGSARYPLGQSTPHFAAYLAPIQSA